MSLSRKILVASGKGGVGKSTVAVNLGRALARRKQRVVIIDMDFCLNNLDVLARVEDRIVFDISDCIANRCRVKQALLQDAIYPSMFILPSDWKNSKEGVRAADVGCIVEELRVTFDYCIFDCPAGLGEELRLAYENCDEAICVCTQHLTSIRDCSRLIKNLGAFTNARYLVLNRYRPDLAKSKKLLCAQEVFELLSEATPIGIIPEDECLDCLESDSLTEQYFDAIADNLHNGKRKLYTFEKGKKLIL